MSRRRLGWPLSRYSLSPVRYSRRATPISLQGTDSVPSLEKLSTTSASPTPLREVLPWKIRSSIFWPRSDLALCSPNAQRTASEMFDFPHPLGPTMPVMPGRTLTVVFSPNDLKPWRVIASRRMGDCCTRFAERPNKNHQPWGAGGPSPPDVASPARGWLLLEEVPEGALGVVGANGAARG